MNVINIVNMYDILRTNKIINNFLVEKEYEQL